MTELHFIDVGRIDLVELSDLGTASRASLTAPVLICGVGDAYWLHDSSGPLPEPHALDPGAAIPITWSASEPPDEPSVVLQDDRVVGIWAGGPLDDLVPDVGSWPLPGGMVDFEPATAPERAPASGMVDFEPPREREPAAAPARWDPMPYDSPGEISDIAPLVEDDDPGDGRQRDQAIRRTPHLDAPSSIPTAAGSTFDVAVRLNTEPFEAEEIGDEFVLEVPPDIAQVTIGVLLTTSSQFDVKGDAYKHLVVERDRDESGPVAFVIEVTDTPAPDEAGITALLVYNGHSCGTVTRRWSWDPNQPQARAKQLTHPANDATVALETEPAGLSIFITRPINDGIHFCCAVQSSVLDAYREPTVAEEWALPETAPTFVQSRIERIVSGGDREERRSALLEVGVEFYEAAPPLFKKVLWEIIDAGKAPCSIYIASSEPALPWELMVPHRLDDDGLAIDRRPLGVEFPIGRWVRGDGKSPSPPRIEVNRSFVVAPRYRVSKQLDATSELDFLSAELAGERIDPAGKRDLEARFATEPAELIHFVCHGAAGEEGDFLYLDDDKELRATAVRTSDGFKALCRSSRPLVFINACEAGALTPTIGGVGGFPKALGEIGARAVIAPLWSVVSATAGAVAVEIYRRALATPAPTLGQVIRDIRARSYDDDEFDDSFAAYCLFGDPLATLTRPSLE